MFSLRNKLFLAFLLSGALLVAGMLALFQWSFSRGFLDYIRQVDQTRLDTLATRLERRLQNGLSLEELVDAGTLLQLLDELPPPPHRQHPEPPFPGDPDSPDYRHDPRPRPPDARFRFFILDAAQQPLAGFYRPHPDNHLRALRRGDQVLGYVGLKPKKVPHDFLEQRFAAAQSQNFLWLAGLALAVSALVAFPLASLLVKRIARLVEQVRQLSAGHYDHRIALPGQDELNLLALHLNDLGKTLQETAQSRRRLVADISHELRTPIATLRGQLEAIEDGVRPLDTHTVRRLHEQVMRLSGLVNDLYELSLADVGALSYRKQMLDLRDLLVALVQSMQPQFQTAGLELSLLGMEQALPVLGDEQRLTQLFANLLQNSLHYTHAPGRVQISASLQKGHAVVTVQDSAPGVDRQLHDRLFERLFRAESSRNRTTGGAGLGLSLCQSIVHAHDGHIVIDDSTLGGLAVTVHIPLAKVTP